MIKDVLVIILNWNDAEMTIGCLENTIKVEGTKEIIVIDNGSEKKERQCLIDHFKKNNYQIFKEDEIEHIQDISRPVLLLLEDNYGYSKGNNFGLRLSCALGYRYSLIINDDIRMKVPTLMEMAQVLDADDSIGLAGPKVLNDYSGKTQGPYRDNGIYMYFLYPVFLPFLFIPDLAYKKIRSIRNNKNRDKIRFPYTVIGCYLFIRNIDVKKVGFLDENVFLYSEEFILSERMKQIGKRIAYVPYIEIIHYPGTSTNKLGSKRIKMKEKSLLYYLRTYKKYGQIRLTMVRIGDMFYTSIWNRLRL